MSTQDSEILVWLQNWYANQCDGLWEHSYGIDIGTIDNPGWKVKIDLKGTALDGKSFEKKRIENNEDDWIIYWTENSVFEAAGGIKNLVGIIKIFKKWVETGVV